MSDRTEEILTALKLEDSESIGAHEGALADEIEDLNAYYHGKPYGNEVEGRSQLRTREVYETVESIMPYLVKIFFSSEKAVIFDPEDEDDTKAAEQETEYVNWVFYKDNPGFRIGYQWLKDGLMNKVGYVSAIRETAAPTYDVYENKTEEQVGMLLSSLGDDFEGDVQLIQKDDDLVDVKIIKQSGRERTVVSNIPPEELRISEEATSVCDARYVGRVCSRTISDIRALGFEIDDDVEDDNSSLLSIIKQDRHEDISNQLFGEDGQDLGAARQVSLREEYLRYDIDDDGITELLQVFRVGDEVLSVEEVDEIPIYSWSPIIVPHRHVGSTPIDPIMDIQLLKSKVTRNLLDNQERINNGRFGVVDGQVNLDDLMSSSPLSVVRMNFQGAVEALPTPKLDQSAFQILGYADSMAEKRSGVSERGQGLDPKMFNSNTAASTAELAMSSAEQKNELVARVFAETGLKELMLGIHRLGLKHEKPGKKIRTNNGQFIPINPEEWRNRYDMNVTVGIGNGSKNQQMIQMQQIEQTMQAIVGAGGLGTIIKPTNVWNLAMEKTKIAGRKDGNLFFTKPESDDVDQGPSVEEQVKMKEVQLKEMQVAVDAQNIDIKKAQLALEERELELQEELARLKERIHEDENQFKIAELSLEAEQKRAVKVGG
tara:strand:+ start:4176 stop:6149 length:1974 start_codon:yes stop_codon:yes gene_type:complete